MGLLWEDRAWEEYLYWQMQDRKTLKRLNAIIRDIQRNPLEGIGKSERLKGNRGADALMRRIVWNDSYCFLPWTLRELTALIYVQMSKHKLKIITSYKVF